MREDDKRGARMTKEHWIPACAGMTGEGEIAAGLWLSR